MKKLEILLFSVALFAFAIISSNVYAQDAERIESFHSDINLESNGIVTVKEKIQYFFPSAESDSAKAKHGIIRNIPVKYRAHSAGTLTGEVNIYFDLTSVNIEKDNGQTEPVPFEKSSSGNNVVIRIGDANKTVNGLITYVIAYKAQRAINFSPKGNENQDEFYWNVTGNGWEVPIQKADATIKFPADINPDTWKFACFTGPLGIENKECSEEATSVSSVQFASNWDLKPKEGLTILTGFPKGIITQPTTSQNVILALKYNILTYLFLLIPFIAFIILFILWFLKGRDPKGKGTIIPFYSPPDNLTPIELGTLVDEKADIKDISSVIIDLAVRGYLKIREIEKKAVLGIFKGNPDYELIQLKRSEFLPGLEKKVFDIIFPVGEHKVNLSDLNERFPQKVSEIKTAVYANLVDRGYFPKSPQRVRNTYLFLGAVVAFLGIILFVNQMGVIGSGSMFITGGMIAIFSLFMPQKTIKGVNTYEQILGLKEYLSVAEKDRIEFHNAPVKKPEVFEKLLPYAMVLGVEQQWAKQFEGIYNQPPSWYEGPPGVNFNSLFLINSLSNFSNVANASMGVSRSEGAGAAGGLSGFGGGGGFSGGGFGGGGGSSW